MSPIQDLAFDHVGVSVADLARSQRFYSDVLGFSTQEDSFMLAAYDIRGVVLINSCNVRIELFERRGSIPGRAGHPADSALVHGWFQFALAVTDIEITYERALTLGAKPVMAPRIAPDGVSRVAFIADPDNNLIEFLQRPVKAVAS